MGIGYSSLSAWQQARGHDMHSSDINPMYTSYDSMRTCLDTLDGTGTPLAYVSADFDGDGRNENTPDIGADEYNAGYVAGCSTDPLLFCPDNTMSRAEGAVFVERGIHDLSFLLVLWSNPFQCCPHSVY